MSNEIETPDPNAPTRAEEIVKRATIAGLFSSGEAEVVAGTFIKTPSGEFNGDWHLVRYVYLEGSDNVVNQKMMSCVGVGKSYEYPVSMRKASIVREHDSALNRFHGERTLVWVDDLGNVFTTRPELDEDTPIKNLYLKTRYTIKDEAVFVDDQPFSPVGFDWHIIGKAEKAYVVGSLPYKASLLTDLNNQFDLLNGLREKAMKGLFAEADLMEIVFTAENECDTCLVGNDTLFELATPLLK